MQQENTPPSIILGIDPGTLVMGYGLIRHTKANLMLISLGVVKLNHLNGHMLKLQHIYQSITRLIDQHQPNSLAIEAPFYGKNIQAMLKLGRAQGVAMAAGLMKSLPIYEYSPKQIKQAITGNGNASKEQVAAMLQRLLNFEGQPSYLDATDGLAAAVCHSFQKKDIKTGNKVYASWEAFAKNHTARIMK